MKDVVDECFLLKKMCEIWGCPLHDYIVEKCYKGKKKSHFKVLQR